MLPKIVIIILCCNFGFIHNLLTETVMLHRNIPLLSPSIEIVDSSESRKVRQRPVLNLIRNVSRRSWNASPESGVRNRKKINGHLRSVATSVKNDLKLSEEGYCYFQFKKFIIVVEVPSGNGGLVFFYTMVCQLGVNDNRKAVMKEAMTMNYMQQRTRGATLGLEGDEVNLCFSVPIRSITREEFGLCIEDFMHTAEEMNNILDSAKMTII